MKIGLTSSVAMHVLLIGAGLFSLSAPRPLDSSNFESFPVEMVPLAELSTSVRGEREAPVSPTPAPEPTTEEEPIDSAQNIGNNQVDLPTSASVPGNRPVEAASAPPPAEEPPAPQPLEQPVVEPDPEPVPAEPVETAAIEPDPDPEPVPVEEAAPEPAEEPAIAEEQPRDVVQLPSNAPRPQVRPQPQTQPARSETQRPVQETVQQPAQESDFNADEIAALLTQEEARGGGAQRSNQQASLGGRETTGAVLSQSEIDSLRSQVQRCWNPPVGASGAESLVVSIRFQLLSSGEIDGSPQVVASSGDGATKRAAEMAAQRAVVRCAPYNAPADRHEAWADIQFNFDPRDMF